MALAPLRTSCRWRFRGQTTSGGPSCGARNVVAGVRGNPRPEVFVKRKHIWLPRIPKEPDGPRHAPDAHAAGLVGLEIGREAEAEPDAWN